MALSRDQIEFFVNSYIESGCNATEAYAISHPGCSRNTARAEGWRTLRMPAIRTEIDLRMASLRVKSRMTAEQVADLLQDFATVDVFDLFDEDGALRPLSEMSPSARRCIASIEVEESTLAGAEDAGPVRVVCKKVKLVDKKGAAELLARYKKLFTDTNVEGLTVSVNINGKMLGGEVSGDVD
jgi:phage terminase small subunit